ncbi:MAG: hypothetical protein RL272_832 [Candidatus Parcubacteria bacterium]|jgi:hypothetical protein
MRSTKTLVVLASLLAAGTSAAAIAAHAEPRMVHVSETIKEMFADLDAATAHESDAGCTEDDGRGGKRLCGDSKSRVDALHDDAMRMADGAAARPPQARERAMAAIRAFRADRALGLAYRSTSQNPYSGADDKKIEIYADNDGNEYWIDPADDVLVQAGPGAGLHTPPRKTRPEARLAVAELRARALEIVQAQMPGFASRKSSFHPLEDNKDKQLYFFRWDDFSQPAKESEMPPFVQVGLDAEGRIVSFTNTLAR